MRLLRLFCQGAFFVVCVYELLRCMVGGFLSNMTKLPWLSLKACEAVPLFKGNYQTLSDFYSYLTSGTKPTQYYGKENVKTFIQNEHCKTTNDPGCGRYIDSTDWAPFLNHDLRAGPHKKIPHDGDYFITQPSLNILATQRPSVMTPTHLHIIGGTPQPWETYNQR